MSCDSSEFPLKRLFAECLATNPPNGSVNVTRWTLSCVNLEVDRSLMSAAWVERWRSDPPTSTPASLPSLRSAAPLKDQDPASSRCFLFCGPFPSLAAPRRRISWLSCAWHQGAKKRFLNSCRLHRSAATPNNVHVFVPTLPSWLYRDYF